MDNLGYVMAGYAVTFFVITGYLVMLVRRVRRARRDIDSQAAGPGG